MKGTATAMATETETATASIAGTMNDVTTAMDGAVETVITEVEGTTPVMMTTAAIEETTETRVAVEKIGETNVVEADVAAKAKNAGRPHLRVAFCSPSVNAKPPDGTFMLPDTNSIPQCKQSRLVRNL
jgi:hypothetical protein